MIFLILALAAILRVFGLNWDQGFHLHPDERQMVMVTERIDFSSFSNLNPHFFAYGSFPIYLLKIAGNIGSFFDQSFGQYSGINLVGRLLSVLADLGIIVLIFGLGKRLFNKEVGLIGAFLYAVSVFPLQAAHFYTVDTLLTFFILATLWRLIVFYETPTKRNALLVGALFGLSLATKVSALVLIVSFGTALFVDFLLVFLKKPHHFHLWAPYVPKVAKTLFTDGLLIAITTLITFLLFEPYALLDFREFWRQTLEQYQMTHNAFTFPYTLQYVGKIPYFYELKNVFLWGQGPVLATLSFLGTLYFILLALRKHVRVAQELILLTFFLAYFFVVGSFAIGFMRYMLPLYPLLSLFAAVLIWDIAIWLKTKTPSLMLNTFYLILATSLLVWPLSFISIYFQPNTRTQASQWINKNILPGSTIAFEHWDDSLPLFGQEKYQTIALPLYDPDTSVKWAAINQTLARADYIIIASNRLYVPLQKLTNCQKLPPGKCYPLTAEYYKKLFAGNLGFQKAAEFSVYPKLEVSSFKLEVDDSSADESFTVYDHPKIMIFKKNEIW